MTQTETETKITVHDTPYPGARNSTLIGTRSQNPIFSLMEGKIVYVALGLEKAHVIQKHIDTIKKWLEDESSITSSDKVRKGVYRGYPDLTLYDDSGRCQYEGGKFRYGLILNHIDDLDAWITKHTQKTSSLEEHVDKEQFNTKNSFNIKNQTPDSSRNPKKQSYKFERVLGRADVDKWRTVNNK